MKIAESLPLSANARVAAAIVIANEIVAIGVNENKTHPMAKRFGKNDKAITLHAEISAIKNALRVISVKELSRSTLYIARARMAYRDGPFVTGNAKPCAGCRRAIETFGINKVICTDDHHPGEEGSLALRYTAVTSLP